MCGDHDDHDHEHDQLETETFHRLIHFASHYDVMPDASAGNTPVTLENEKMRSAYLDGLFRAALTRTVNDAAHITEGERLDIIAGQAIVFARLAGVLAGLLPVESGQFHTVISATMQGYNEPASIEHDH